MGEVKSGEAGRGEQDASEFRIGSVELGDASVPVFRLVFLYIF